MLRACLLASTFLCVACGDRDDGDDGNTDTESHTGGGGDTGGDAGSDDGGPTGAGTNTGHDGSTEPGTGTGTGSGAGGGCGTEPGGEQAERVADFLDTIGINVHVEYTDGDYADIGAVIADLAYLGVRYVRDGNLDPNNQGQASYGIAADAGIMFTLHTGGDPYESVQRIHDFVVDHPGSVSAIEGPNEVNNWPIEYDGLTGDEAAIAFQTDLFEAVNADPLVADIPVYGVTSWPELASPCDYGNYHSYAHEGDQPFSWLESGFEAQQSVFDPEPPMVLTETGYYTMPGGPGWEGVDDESQAKMLLNTYFDAFVLDVARTFVYQLLDAYPDPGYSDMETHFGLFDIDDDPKAAAEALRNLTTIFHDNGAEAETFTPGSLAYSVESLPQTARTLLFQRSDCAFALVLWDEPDIWNEDADVPIDVPATTVTVRLGSVHDRLDVHDPLQHSDPIATETNATEIDVDLTDHPIIVMVD
jgi:hypothetical protein